MDLIKKHAEKLKFALVGGANTALDFLVLFVLVATGVNAIAANYISTSVAFIFSFFVNKSFTFQNKSKKVVRQFVLFVLITIFGLWVIQPVVITAVSAVLVGTSWSSEFILLIAKLVATVASLIWNYIFYTKLVFKKGA